MNGIYGNQRQRPQGPRLKPSFTIPAISPMAVVNILCAIGVVAGILLIIFNLDTILSFAVNGVIMPIIATVAPLLVTVLLFGGIIWYLIKSIFK